MRIDMNWVRAAHEALKKSGIVDDAGNYPKAFKGYISSLGASIIQTGLLPALSIYESDNPAVNSSVSGSNASGASAENNRAYLIYAIVCMLQKMDIIKDKEKVCMLTDYLEADKDSKTNWLRHIDSTLIALKLAIRVYKPSDCIRNESKNFASITKTSDKSECDNVKDDSAMERDSDKLNLGWAYYKNLYRGYCKSCSDEFNEKQIERKIQKICEAKFENYKKCVDKLSSSFEKEEGYSCFELTTVYPGLVIGTGLAHGVRNKSDIKTGMQFDHSTGLPYIPGSSLKGVLRSVFPESADDKPRLSFIKEILKDIGVNFSDGSIIELCKELFESGNGVIFLDAFIVSGNSNGNFISTDYITPHRKPLKNPVPIKILKVCPEVTFRFPFIVPALLSLPDGVSLSRCKVMSMFKKILLYIGAGAKTNVGYGHFRNTK